MAYSTIFLCVLCGLANLRQAQSVSQYPKLLVVSYDGFRYDYFDRNVTSYMKNLKNAGTHADYMINAFVTKTFPNHHTIATGFYTETHGVIDGQVYVSNKTIGDSPELFQYNKNILPIWTMNEKEGNGRHSGTVMWPGSQYEYNKTNPAFTQKFNITVPWKERIDNLISWFLHPSTPINFGILYIEEPDFHAHGYGVNSPVITELLKKLDNITKYLDDQLEEHGLDDVNVIHLSDHGMVSVTPEKIVNITSYIGTSGYNAVSKNSIVLITPDPGNNDIIYNTLKIAANETSKFKVYKRVDVPKRYHFSDNPRIGDIVVTANNGYAFEDLYNSFDYFKKIFNITVNNQSEFGIHGYDNEDMNMHPIFFARGPAFVPRCKLEPFHNVDLFPLFCKILQLHCPAVNGTVKSFSKCLTSPPAASSSPFVSIGIGIIGIFCIIAIAGMGAIVFFLIRRRRRQMQIQYRQILDEAKLEQLWDENQDLESF